MTAADSADDVRAALYASGYFGLLEQYGTHEEVEEATIRPNQWLADHPFIIQSFPAYFAN